MARTSWVSRVVVALLLAVLAVGYVLGGLLSSRIDTTVASFLPEGDPAIAALDEAANSFGGDPIVVLAESDEPRALLGPDQLPKLIGAEGQLSQLPDVAVAYGPGSVLNQIAASAQNLLASLSGRRDAARTAAADQARAGGAGPAEADAAGRAAQAEFDARYAALIVRALPAGLPTVRNPSFVDAVTFDQAGATRSQMQFVVPRENAVAVLVRPRAGLDQAGTERLVQSARDTIARAGLPASKVTVTGTPTVAAALGSTVEQEIPLLGALAVGLIAVCFGAVRWTRRSRHRLLPLAATLSATLLILATLGWLGRPLSLGVVAFLPILIGIGSDFPAYLVNGARRRVVLTTAAASAAGFGALALSPLPFVRDLGIALAAGVLVTMGLGLVMRRFLVPPATDGHAAPPDPSARSARRGRLFSRSERAGGLIALMLVAAVGWVALPHLTITARPDQLAAGLPAVQDAMRAEEVLGSSGEVQILLRGDNVATPESLRWMREAQDGAVLRFGDRLRPIVSLPDLLRFLGPDPSREEIAAALDLVPDYLAKSVLRVDHKQSVISLGLRLQDVGAQKALLDELRMSLPPPPPGTSVDVAGLPVAAGRAYTLIEDDLYLANVAGIVAAGAVLLIGLRRRVDAGRAVLAAALATGWGFAMAALLDLSLSPLTVALGSLTTATACEFTILLAQEGARGGIRRTVGVAAAAAALGYLALAASGIAVIREFGLFLAAAVLLSLAASWAVTTALPRRVGADRTAREAEPDELRDAGRCASSDREEVIS